MIIPQPRPRAAATTATTNTKNIDNKRDDVKSSWRPMLLMTVALKILNKNKEIKGNVAQCSSSSQLSITAVIALAC